MVEISASAARKLAGDNRLTQAASSYLAQWYECLAIAKEEQDASGAAKPDFSSHWIIEDYDQRKYVMACLKDAGIDVQVQAEVLPAYLQHLLGDQLAYHGIEPRPYRVSNGLESAIRYYLLKPGQEPTIE